MSEVRVETVTLSEIGVALVLLDQERRNKISALTRVKRKIAELDQLRLQYATELAEVDMASDKLTNKKTYDRPEYFEF